MDFDEAIPTFIAEARELLQDMEDALLRVEANPDDVELVNAIFRAAHTIKGSAGVFGLDHVVGFTHVAESVLDRVRDGSVHLTPALVATLLRACDHLKRLVDHLADGREPDAEDSSVGEALREELRGHLGAAVAPAQPPVPHVAHVERSELEGASTEHWHLSLRFNPDVTRNGLDPLCFLRYLTTFGRIAHIVTLTEAVPALAKLDPEACWLGFEIAYESQADKATIEGAFEFVKDDARIRILPPHSKVDDYIELIAGMPNEEMRLGEILVNCGTLTPKELEAALQAQATSADSPPPRLGEVVVAQKTVRPPVVDAALDKQKQVKEHKAADTGLIRVNAEKLDQHINLIGELIIASAGAGVGATQSGNPELIEAMTRMARLVEQIRDSALGLRMVQIGATFNRFQRVVRDVSAELGKDIRLEIRGAETELDKTVVEKIGDPLMHLVRNSMDHGIETAEVRTARGKPAHGTVSLNAYHDSGSIVIEVIDDGGGLDRGRILAKAVERGLVRPDQQLSDAEIHTLIFAAGFSTAETVSNLSGRGVGMDVVRQNIAALRGTVDIASVEGEGTTIRIRLPLTLAIIDGFLVGVQASTFVIPLESVIECVELTQEQSAAAHGSDYINLRGEVLPFIRLKSLFRIAEQEPAEILTEAGANGVAGYGSLLTADGAAALARDPELAFLLHPVARENIVVVNYAGRRAGLVVDRLMGEFQTVIRPLGDVFGGLEGVSGFTILGDGKVALILDVANLVRKAASLESLSLNEAAVLPASGKLIPGTSSLEEQDHDQ